MAGVVFTEMPKGGFSFELCKRCVSISAVQFPADHAPPPPPPTIVYNMYV